MSTFCVRRRVTIYGGKKVWSRENAQIDDLDPLIFAELLSSVDNDSQGGEERGFRPEFSAELRVACV